MTVTHPSISRGPRARFVEASNRCVDSETIESDSSGEETMFLLRCAHDDCDAKIWEHDDGSELWRVHGDKHFCPAHANDMQSGIVGFTEPEDGSESRYRARVARRPWVHHTTWWIIHNAIAHPLIAFVPVRSAFRFHDWTSRKMHGK